MNQIFIEYVKTRLLEWAEWHCKGNFVGLGFSSFSIEYRLMVEGIINKRQGPRPLPSNEDAEEIEIYWVEMYKQNEPIAVALHHHYLIEGTLQSRSKLMGISHSQFRHYVQMGFQWMAGRLSANCKDMLCLK